MGAFRSPVDIANRALQLLRRPAIYSFADPTVEAHECANAYEQLRLSELRRSLWRFSTRRVILRSISPTSLSLTPPAWAIGTAYAAGDIVTYGYQSWVALSVNTGNEPDIVPASGQLYWDSYFGSTLVDVWSSQGYFINELVYQTPGNGTYTVYRSLVSNNSNDPAAVDAFDATVVYKTGQVVSYGGTNYQSLSDLNFNHTPPSSQWTTTITSSLVSNSWRAISATLAATNIEYPLSAGPSTDSRTRNAYVLPAGWLRQAPTDPKAGINPFLGAPTGNMTPDWLFEGNFLVSQNADPIMLRFVADTKAVPSYDPMFAEALSTRLAMELAPRLADAEHLSAIIATCRDNYGRTMTEAREVNGIETGPVDPYEDDFITARL